MGSFRISTNIFGLVVFKSDHLEAKRVADYTRKMKKLPLRIRDVLWDGLYIEYALVAEMSGVNRQAA